MLKIAIWNIAYNMEKEYPIYHYNNIFLVDGAFEDGISLVRTALIRMAND